MEIYSLYQPQAPREKILVRKRISLLETGWEKSCGEGLRMGVL